jgi:hypothetical protein
MSTAVTIRFPDLPQSVEIAPKWIEARDAILTEVEAIAAVADAETFEAGSELLRRITKTSNALEKFRKEFAEPFAEAARLVKRAADTAREPLEVAKGRLQNLLARYATEQQRKADEERKRIEAEQRAAIEKQMAERAAAEAAAADLGIDELPPEPEIVAPVIIPETSRARADAVRVQESVEWEVIDEGAVPVAFKMVDDRRINGWLAQNKDLVRKTLKDEPYKSGDLVPGIRFEIKTKVMSR